VPARDSAEAAAAPRFAPLFASIRPYDRAWLSRDIVAGITLAALAIPEVMGYTKIAGTPVITGLYTILLPIVAFALFASSRHLVVGGDSATAAIMYAGIASLGVVGLQPYTSEWTALASVSALLTGAFLLVARLARVGFLADFISRTVLVGFLTGVGIQVAMGQVAGMLGVPEPKVSAGAASGTVIKFVDTLGEIGSASVATVSVSAGVIATLVVFDRWIKAIPGGLVAVVGSIAISSAFDLSAHGVSTLGSVPSGLPHVGLPHHVTWSQTTELAATSLSMVVVILAQSAATARAYAVKYQERFVENDDLLGLSAANVAAGVTGTFVVNGSPTKTEMVDEAKSHTQVAQLTTAAVVAIVLLFLTGPLKYLPNAVLSAVVFVIGLKLVDIRQMRDIWRLRKDEFVVALLTAAVVVNVGVEQGIILAILLSIVLHVRRHYAPHDVVIRFDSAGQMSVAQPVPGTVSEPGLVIYHFAVGVFYANAERLATEAHALVDGLDPPKWFVLDATAIDDVDYTGGQTLAELSREFRSRGVVFAVITTDPRLRRELERFGVMSGTDRWFDTVAAARAAFQAAAGRSA
jgi:high affinity sulfate transporter 1